MSEESFSLDRALLGTARAVRVALPCGATVTVRALCHAELIEAADHASDARGSVGESARAGLRHRVLAIACSHNGRPAFDGPDDVARWPSDDVAALWSSYRAVHASVYEVGAEARRSMSERLHADDVWIERARAKYAAAIVAFYGLKRATDATAVQVAWFDRLMERESR